MRVYDRGRFLVASRTVKGKDYIVSLTAYKKNGSCNCPSFRGVIEPYVREGKESPRGWRCPHIVDAKTHVEALLYDSLLELWIAQDGHDHAAGPSQGQNSP